MTIELISEQISHWATLLFAISLVHTFSVSFFVRWANHFKSGSLISRILHLLGEVELVFAFWSLVFISIFFIIEGQDQALAYLSSRSYSEPLFVVVIMVVCASKPIADLVNGIVGRILKIPFLKPPVTCFFALLAFAPLLGSFITEPAAMTIIATLILKLFFETNPVSDRLKYGILGLLFVNISIGGLLTSYAAPAVLMVSQKWHWDIVYMMMQFGWKSILACFVSTGIYFLLFKESIMNLKISVPTKNNSPCWVQWISILFVVFTVVNHQKPFLFLSGFGLFCCFVLFTRSFQEKLKMRDSILVGFFLTGLVVLGGMQNWWLEPLVAKVSEHILFVGSIGLTALTDNAALTYLGSLVETMTEESKYALVSGAMIGGGLTVIANAPNPVGFGILNRQFGTSGIKASSLFVGAIIPTLVAAAIFRFF